MGRPVNRSAATGICDEVILRIVRLLSGDLSPWVHFQESTVKRGVGREQLKRTRRVRARERGGRRRMEHRHEKLRPRDDSRQMDS
jgi:hypothetical protein